VFVRVAFDLSFERPVRKLKAMFMVCTASRRDFTHKRWVFSMLDYFSLYMHLSGVFVLIVALRIHPLFMFISGAQKGSLYGDMLGSYRIMCQRNGCRSIAVLRILKATSLLHSCNRTEPLRHIL